MDKYEDAFPFDLASAIEAIMFEYPGISRRRVFEVVGEQTDVNTSNAASMAMSPPLNGGVRKKKLGICFKHLKKIRTNLQEGLEKDELATYLPMIDGLEKSLRMSLELGEGYWGGEKRGNVDWGARLLAVIVYQVFKGVIGSKPTIGTKGDSDDPSTPYCKLLANCFVAAGIKTHFRRPAEFARSNDTNTSK